MPLWCLLIGSMEEGSEIKLDRLPCFVPPSTVLDTGALR